MSQSKMCSCFAVREIVSTTMFLTTIYDNQSWLTREAVDPRQFTMVLKPRRIYVLINALRFSHHGRTLVQKCSKSVRMARFSNKYNRYDEFLKTNTFWRKVFYSVSVEDALIKKNSFSDYT